MAKIADDLMDELKSSVKDLVDNFGKHDGDCTNAAQLLVTAKVVPCSKHLKMLEQRKERVEQALLQIELLRDVFAGVRD